MVRLEHVDLLKLPDYLLPIPHMTNSTSYHNLISVSQVSCYKLIGKCASNNLYRSDVDSNISSHDDLKQEIQSKIVLWCDGL